MGPEGERGSGNFEQLSCEISQNLWPARSEMDVVLYTDSSPPRTVNSWLDGHYGALPKEGLDGLRQTGGLVDLEPQSMPQAVPEGLAVAMVLNVAASQTIGILTLHPRTHGPGSDGIGMLHDVIDLALLRSRPTEHDGSGDVRAVALVLRAEIHEQQIPPLDHARRCPRVRKRSARPGRHDGSKRKILA